MASELLMAEEGVSDESYEKGIQLIKTNCYDCYGGTKKGLELGVSILEKWTQKKVDNPKIYTTLAEGYRDLALTHYQHGSKEREMFLAKEREILKKAFKLDPENIDLHNKYISRMPIDQQVGELEKIYEGNADASRSLAMIYIYGRNEIEKGIGYLQLAYELAQGHTKIEYGRELLDLISSQRSAAEYVEFKAIYLKDKEEIMNPKKKDEEDGFTGNQVQ